MAIVTTTPPADKDQYTSPILTKNGHAIYYTANYKNGMPTVTDMYVTDRYTQTITRLEGNDMASLSLSLMMREAGNATVQTASDRENDMMRGQAVAPSMAKYSSYLGVDEKLEQVRGLGRTGQNMLMDSLAQLSDLVYRIDNRMEGKEKALFAAPPYAEYSPASDPHHGVNGSGPSSQRRRT